eukprot:TRINITY_DN6572_c0_g1_i1.p1 TRINITY_DN6572_c0_g1~~TRINITY_DN6572_c0_g1_i1.p1  ORF type:complete len:140 (+),score=16.67 TRINITY_DN6572_c0_g1_i1:458-877(+)
MYTVDSVSHGIHYTVVGCVFVAPWKRGFTNFVFPIAFPNAYHTRIIFYMVFFGIVENQLIFATFPLRKIYATHQTMKMSEHGCGEMNGCAEMKLHGCVLKVPFMFSPFSFQFLLFGEAKHISTSHVKVRKMVLTSLVLL